MNGIDAPQIDMTDKFVLQRAIPKNSIFQLTEVKKMFSS